MTRRWKAGNESKEATDWFNVEVWGRLGELSQQYLKKGSLVYIEGRLQTDKYEDKSGETKYFTKVVASTLKFLDRKPAEEPMRRDGGGGGAGRLRRLRQKVISLTKRDRRRWNFHLRRLNSAPAVSELMSGSICDELALGRSILVQSDNDVARGKIEVEPIPPVAADRTVGQVCHAVIAQVLHLVRVAAQA